jgi:hypothetical protein
VCLGVGVVVVGVVEGDWLGGLGIVLYIVSVSFTLVLLGVNADQGELLPRQEPLPAADVSRLRRSVTLVAVLGFAILVFCGFVDSARTAGFLALAAVSLPLWVYESTLAWRGPDGP